MTIEKLYHLTKEEVLKGHKEFSVERLKNAIDDYIFTNETILDNERAALDYIESKFEVINIFKTNSRKPRYVWARYVYFWYLHRKRCEGYSDVARRYGKHHATIMYGVRQIRENHKSLLFYKEIKQIKEALI